MSADRPKIRAVFDCMVFLQGAARRESASGACLLLVELEAVELCLSKEILSEIRDVLARSRLRRKFPVLSDELVERFLAAIEKRAVLVLEVPRVFVYERDPKDEPYINLAIAAGANYLVSRDTDVLDLAKLSNPDGGRLRNHTPHLQILDPVSFLAEARRRLQRRGSLAGMESTGVPPQP